MKIYKIYIYNGFEDNLYTDRVYNHKIDDYINSTSIKQLGGK